jgi:hypothetical protein
MADLPRWEYGSPLAPLGAVELVPLRLDGPGPLIPPAFWIVGDWRTDEAGECLRPLPRRTESIFRCILRGDGSPGGGCILLMRGRTTSPSSPFGFDPQVDAFVCIVADPSPPTGDSTLGWAVAPLLDPDSGAGCSLMLVPRRLVLDTPAAWIPESRYGMVEDERYCGFIGPDECKACECSIEVARITLRVTSSSRSRPNWRYREYYVGLQQGEGGTYEGSWDRQFEEHVVLADFEWWDKLHRCAR